MKIVADQDIPNVTHFFSSVGELVLRPGRALSPIDVSDADILLVRSITPVNRELLNHSTVKFVGSVTAGFDHLDTNWLNAEGIKWALASGFNALTVADYVMSVLALDQSLSQRKKAAVIGVGHVGRIVAARLAALHFEVTLCDPLRAESDPSFPSVAIEDITDMDIISFHVPLTRKGNYPTDHFITPDFLTRQRQGCLFINTSRGEIVSPEVLLDHGQQLVMCFDVWEGEPVINPALLDSAWIATPHIAGYSVQSKIRGVALIYHKLCEFGIISREAAQPLLLPRKEIHLPHLATWQEVVLSVFNPLFITKEMRVNQSSQLFDLMRLRFNERYELNAVDLLSAVKEQDRPLLKLCGVNLD